MEGHDTVSLVRRPFICAKPMGYETPGATGRRKTVSNTKNTESEQPVSVAVAGNHPNCNCGVTDGFDPIAVLYSEFSE